MTKNKTDKNPDQPAVVMIEDPFQMHDLEISNAQSNPEELDLDQDIRENLSESEEDLVSMESLSQAMAHEEKRQEKELTALSEEATPDTSSEQILANQIAEDQALEAELAQENAEAEETDEELKAALPKNPVADENGAMDLSEMQSCIEAILFMSDKPISAKKMQELLGEDISLNLFQEALTELSTRYQSTAHGFELTQINGGYQFRTKAARAPLARKLAKIRTQRLSSGGMESLAIIAYRQPVLKEDIDKIRGVDSSYFIRGLLDKKLIKIVGRSDLPGRPMQYATTDEFLELFNLKDLSAMPSLREVEAMIPTSQTVNPDDEDPRVKEMRRLVGQMKADGSTSLKYDPREDEKILQEMREKIGSISTSTPYLEEQKQLEKISALAAKEGLTLEQYLDREKALEAAAKAPAVEVVADAESASEDSAGF
jgi:segregation and condensation protein B